MLISKLNGQENDIGDMFQKMSFESSVDDFTKPNISIVDNAYDNNPSKFVSKIKTSRGPFRQMFPKSKEIKNVHPENSGIGVNFEYITCSLKPFYLSS